MNFVRLILTESKIASETLKLVAYKEEGKPTRFTVNCDNTTMMDTEDFDAAVEYYNMLKVDDSLL
ncbi:hypothetical protein D3C76_499700 [compost metagenome]